MKLKENCHESYVNIHQTLNVVRFSGLKTKDFEKVDDKTREYIVKQIKNKFNREFVKTEIKKNNQEIGESIMDELKKTIIHIQKNNSVDKKEACRWFKEVNKEQMSGVLSVEERALLNLAVEYIEKN